MSPSKPRQTLPDMDPEETDEWLESLRTMTSSSGSSRARLLLQELLSEATALGIDISTSRTPYLNSISIDQQKPYPGNLGIEKEIQNHVLWNAAAMVSDANRRMDGIGGHISTYASSSTLYEVGFNHVFRGKDHNGIGDALYIQGHASPGIYSRAFLEGRISVPPGSIRRRPLFIPSPSSNARILGVPNSLHGSWTTWCRYAGQILEVSPPEKSSRYLGESCFCISR